MKLKFAGNISELKKGIEILSKRLGFEIEDNGTEIFIEKRVGNIEVTQNSIKYENKIHFFRALGLYIENYGKEFSITEAPQFNSNGIMIDCSRNAVMKLNKIKDFIEIMAVMGLNLIMMYTEDTYEVPEYPYFGYMRGRYTYEELKECDDYADIFGIEMIPCIQTLAHIQKVLKWNHGLNIKDTDDILLVGSEDTYTFIENLIKAAVRPYRSKRIHIGMDEAGQLGLGEYLCKNGHKTHSAIMKEHLRRVSEITDKLGLTPIMWSDMFFKSEDSTDVGYFNDNVEFLKKNAENIPDNFNLVYWDYENYDIDKYNKTIKNHKILSDKIMFAGGIWMWGSMTISYRHAIKATIPALTSCINNGIKEVFATMWGDNGNQVNIYEALYGLQIYAEFGYGHNYNEEHLKKRFKACTGENAESFLSLDMPDDFGQENLMANPSEYLLWQDIMLGFFDKHIENIDTKAHYKKIKEIMKSNMENSKNYKKIFEYTYYFSNVLEIKADLGKQLKEYYDKKDIENLTYILDFVLPELENRFHKFKEVFRELWLSTYKPFGFEVIDMRVGTVLARIETLKFRLNEYLTGKIDKIEELEEERLYYHLDDWQKYTCKDLNLRTATYLKYVNPSSISMGIGD